jgi:hypothetical protein
MTANRLHENCSLAAGGLRVRIRQKYFCVQQSMDVKRKNRHAVASGNAICIFARNSCDWFAVTASTARWCDIPVSSDTVCEVDHIGCAEERGSEFEPDLRWLCQPG